MMVSLLTLTMVVNIITSSFFTNSITLSLIIHIISSGAVLLFEGEHGTPIAFIEGGALTQIRTAAASAVATKLLAR
jgi:ornithine cyclodeaminase/alanine dehydrogenase-like protein (mu-crystallin family)